jgi:hypothetical protein
VRFGAQRTLNLRERLPTAAAASARAESWLRQQQVDRAGEVLIITGRGNNSEGGVSVVREGVIRLLYSLQRKGVVSGHEEHTKGSFVVVLAPMSALRDSRKQNGGRAVDPPPRTPPSLDQLDADTRILLRDLAERTLEGIGIKDTATFLQGEMLKLFGTIAASVGDVPDREARFRDAVIAALDQTE